MHITVNGEPTSVDEEITVGELVHQRLPSTLGVAVAVNSEVVTTSAWHTTRIKDRDAIEIVTARQGG